MQNASYIGITDFMTEGQVRAMRSALDEVGCERMLAVGVMMSYKTLNGLETKWSKAFPPNDAVAGIFVRSEGVFNVLHYADYDDRTRIHHLQQAVDLAGPNLDAVQFDMICPSLPMLEDLRQYLAATARDVKFILQVNRETFKRQNHSLHFVLEDLEHYAKAGCIDYALYDLSGGTGSPIDPASALKFIEEVRRRGLPFSLAVAGGLGPASMQLVEPVIKALPSVSLDAQSKLRPSGNALDPVDWDMAAAYLRAAAAMFREAESV